ncbi:MAG: PIG-L deacetylase family protein [Desulfitobacteriaceae bacterium]
MTKRLLLIFAHPDDESFALGGTIAKSVSEGAEVVLVSATRGEAGKTAGLCSVEELGTFREQELRQAAEILGISKLIFLDYLDKEVALVPELEIVEKLVRILREFRPQVVITFGEDGASGHRDHRAIHHWTKAAVRLAAQQVEPEWGAEFVLPRLCYVYSTWRLPAGEVPTADFIISTAELSKRKWQAISAHKTQIYSIERFARMPEDVKQRYFDKEYFVCDPVLSSSPGQGEDLFQELSSEGCDLLCRLLSY